MQQAAQPSDLHCRLPRLDLAGVLPIWDVRTVQNDWTVRFENRWFQLADSHQTRALAGRPVKVWQR